MLAVGQGGVGVATRDLGQLDGIELIETHPVLDHVGDRNAPCESVLLLLLQMAHALLVGEDVGSRDLLTHGQTPFR